MIHRLHGGDDPSASISPPQNVKPPRRPAKRARPLNAPLPPSHPLGRHPTTRADGYPRRMRPPTTPASGKGCSYAVRMTCRTCSRPGPNPRSSADGCLPSWPTNRRTSSGSSRSAGASTPSSAGYLLRPTRSVASPCFWSAQATDNARKSSASGSMSIGSRTRGSPAMRPRARLSPRRCRRAIAIRRRGHRPALCGASGRESTKSTDDKVLGSRRSTAVGGDGPALLTACGTTDGPPCAEFHSPGFASQHQTP